MQCVPDLGEWNLNMFHLAFSAQPLRRTKSKNIFLIHLTNGQRECQQICIYIMFFFSCPNHNIVFHYKAIHRQDLRIGFMHVAITKRQSSRK